MKYKHEDQIAHLMPGELVIARVRNPLENPECAGKPRPVVLVRRDGARYWVMGLTSNRTYRCGAPRTPVPRPRSNGLRSQGYLWGSKLTAIDVIDIDRHIGWADCHLVAAILVLARLTIEEATNLIDSLIDSDLGDVA